MNNADMPAMPLTNENGAPIHYSQAGMDNDGVMFGLTKREMMAMNAPDAPSWFCSKWEDENCQDVDFFGESEDEFECKHVYMTNAGKKAMYFAWRAHYADSLLAELERTK